MNENSVIAPPKPKAALFDWDNTLAENWRSIQAALNEALADAGKRPFTLEETMFSGRHSGREVFPRLFGDGWQRARDIFYAHFQRNHLAGLRLMPGAEDLMDSLTACGVPLALVSNKAGDVLRREVEHLGWTRRFATIVGAQDAAADKPHPAPILLALENCELSAGSDIWLIGDTDVDMRAGRAAGCTCVLVGPGPSDPVLLEGAETEFRFDDCSMFAGFIRSAWKTISVE